MSWTIVWHPIQLIIAIAAVITAIDKAINGNEESAWLLVVIAMYAAQAAFPSITKMPTGEKE